MVEFVLHRYDDFGPVAPEARQHGIEHIGRVELREMHLWSTPHQSSKTLGATIVHINGRAGKITSNYSMVAVRLTPRSDVKTPGSKYWIIIPTSYEVLIVKNALKTAFCSYFKVECQYGTRSAAHFF